MTDRRHQPYVKRSLREGGTFAADDTVHMETRSLASNTSTPVSAHPLSDVVMLFLDGSGEILVGDRVHRFSGTRHAHVAAGVTYLLRNTGSSDLRYVQAMCPPGPTSSLDGLGPKATPGGATLLSVEQYDRFPDSGLVRGGMWFLESGAHARYHSHDGAPEVFVFLSGQCEMTVEGEKIDVTSGDVVYVAPEMKHGFFNPGPERLAAWLTVTPNVTPTHTFYDPLPGGSWQRITPRIDGHPVRPPTR